jgi:hypothetical protein
MQPSKTTLPLNPTLINMLSAFGLITFMFFIDEGHYNFQWTKDGWVWLLFFVYTGAAMAGQIITADLLLKNYKGKRKILYTNLIGLPLGIVGLWIIGFAIGAMIYY